MNAFVLEQLRVPIPCSLLFSRRTPSLKGSKTACMKRFIERTIIISDGSVSTVNDLDRYHVPGECGYCNFDAAQEDFVLLTRIFPTEVAQPSKRKKRCDDFPYKQMRKLARGNIVALLFRNNAQT